MNPSLVINRSRRRARYSGGARLRHEARAGEFADAGIATIPAATGGYAEVPDTLFDYLPSMAGLRTYYAIFEIFGNSFDGSRRTGSKLGPAQRLGDHRILAPQSLDRMVLIKGH